MWRLTGKILKSVAIHTYVQSGVGGISVGSAPAPAAGHVYASNVV